MLDHGNGQLSSVGFFNPGLGQAPVGTFFGGGVGGGGMPSVFDIDGNKIVNCGLLFGREWVTCDPVTLSSALGDNVTPNGLIYAKVSHGSSNGSSGSRLSLTVLHAADGVLPENTLSASHRVLYYAVVSGGSARYVDARFAPVLFAVN